MRPAFHSALWLVSITAGAMASEPKTPDKIFVTVEAARALVESDYQMNPEKAAAPRRLEEYLRGRNVKEISIAELQAIRAGQPDSRPKPRKKLPVQTGKAPRDAFDLAVAQQRFAAKEQLNKADGKEKPTAADYENRLKKLAAPGATWFTTKQLLTAEKYEFLTPANEEQRKALEFEGKTFTAYSRAYGDLLDKEEAERQGPRFLRIRRNWRDVLYDEDQSQPDRKSKSIGDLEGALFSFVHDGTAESDTWNAHGALIWPITYNWHRGSALSLRRFAVAPSITYDRVSTNGDPKVEVDSLFYRIGMFADFYGVKHTPPNPDEDEDAEVSTASGYGLQVRASGVYVTDQDHRAGLGGFEVDLEPRFHHGQYGIGYRSNLWPKKPARVDKKDDTFLEAQLRVWLHMEGGVIQDVGGGWSPVEESFFRLGPTTQLTLAAPALPGNRTLSLTLLYSYLAAVSGPSDHPSYFRATLAYDLLRDIQYNHRVGVSASYEKGGLNFTKQEVDTFSLGLNIIF